MDQDKCMEGRVSFWQFWSEEDINPKKLLRHGTKQQKGLGQGLEMGYLLDKRLHDLCQAHFKIGNKTNATITRNDFLKRQKKIRKDL